MLPEGADSAIAIIAIAACATCAPLNPACSGREFEQQLRSAKATVLLVAGGAPTPAVAAARMLDIRVVDLCPAPEAGLGRFLLTSEGEARDAATLADPQASVALLLHTSGSSAAPKAVRLTQDNLCFSASEIGSALELSSMDRALGVMPLYHIHGLSSLLATLASGGSFVSMAGFSTEAFFAALDEFRPSWYSASPTIHRAVLDELARYRGDARESGLRLIRSASAKMPLELIARIESAFGVPLIEAYGMTEAAPQIASNRLPPFIRKPQSVGKAAGPDIATMDQAGVLLPPDVVGEIVIRGRNVARSYGNDSAEVGPARNGWFRTGDLGYLDREDYLFVTGRLTDVINRGGEKISPMLIEQILLEHPDVIEAAVFAVPHAVLGEDIAAAVVLAHGELRAKWWTRSAALPLRGWRVSRCRSGSSSWTKSRPVRTARSIEGIWLSASTLPYSPNWTR